MFRLHDRTRRRLHLTVFASCCLAPTLWMAAWGVWRHLPGRVEQESRRLSRWLRLPARLSGLTYLRPRALRYRGLELGGADAERPVLRCPVVEAVWRAGESEDGRDTLGVVLLGEEAEGDLDQWGSMSRLLDDLIAGRMGFGSMTVRATMRQWVVTAGSRPFSLRNVRARIESSPDRAEAELSFLLGEGGGSEPVRLWLQRDGRGSAMQLRLATGGTPLPCPLLEAAFGRWPSMGAESTFAGRIQATGGPGGWHGELAGRFLGVDLGRLAQGRIAHQVEGRAEVTIQWLQFSPGCVDRVSGSLVAGPGRVSRSLVDAAAGHLGLIRALGQIRPDSVVSFDQLAFAFSWDAAGLRLQGQCASPAGGVILTDRSGPVLGDPGSEPIPLDALVRTLFPSGAVQVPATRQAARLMSWLPLPPSGPSAPATAGTGPRERPAASLR